MSYFRWKITEDDIEFTKFLLCTLYQNECIDDNLCYKRDLGNEISLLDNTLTSSEIRLEIRKTYKILKRMGLLITPANTQLPYISLERVPFQQLVNNRDTYFRHPKANFECFFCSQRYDSYQHLNEHHFECHRNETLTPKFTAKFPKKVISIRPVKYPCTECYQKFDTEKAVKAHITAQHFPKSDAELLITLEGVKGNGNLIETLYPQEITVPLILTNNSTAAKQIALDFVVEHMKFKARITPALVRVQGNSSVTVNIEFLQKKISVFDCSIKCTDDQNAFVKPLTIEYNSEICKDLHATTRFIKQEHAYFDMSSDRIIPAEPIDYCINRSSISVVPLRMYRLTMTYIEAFKQIHYHKPSENISKEVAVVLSYVKGVLESVDLTNPLNPRNYKNLLEILLKLEEYQMNINIRKYDTSSTLERVQHLYRLYVPDLAEYRPSLLRGDSVYVKYNEKYYQGLVERTELDNVLLRFNRHFNSVWVKGMKFDIVFGFNRLTIRLEHRALFGVTNDLLKYVLFPSVSTGVNYTEPDSLSWINTIFTPNAKQAEAINRIFANTSMPAPYILFGPPGTGKTMTVVETILQIWRHQPNKKILVCTPSNTSANVITIRLADQVTPRDMLRLISFSFPYSEIPDTIVKYCNYHPGTEEFYYPENNVITSKRIVITTLASAGRLVSWGIGNNHYDYIFIDESGHATETEILIPLAGLAEVKRTQVVLVGDPKQLGAVIQSPMAIKYGFATSMLERLMTTSDAYQKSADMYNPNMITKLLINYRSHKEIVDAYNQFYDNELVAYGGLIQDLAIGSVMLKKKDFPLMFHSVNGVDEREENSPSFFNLQEIEVVIQYLKVLIGSRLKGMLIRENDIGIISPYRKQIKKITAVCQKLKYNFPKGAIGSVEQLQGQEKTIVIVSTVRSRQKYLNFDAKFFLGFVSNPKRFNVAISRAKSLIIVIGNGSLLCQDPYWKSYISRCVENNNIYGDKFVMSNENSDSSRSSSPSEGSYDMVKDLEMLTLEGDESNFSRGNI